MSYIFYTHQCIFVSSIVFLFLLLLQNAAHIAMIDIIYFLLVVPQGNVYFILARTKYFLLLP